MHGESILLLDHTSGDLDGWGGSLGAGRYAALANLKGDVFPGMIVLDNDGLALPLETFEVLLNSIVTGMPAGLEPA